jgi:hypothetical protein
MRRTSGRIRKMKQKLRRRYTCDREDRQLSGLEPTVPESAVHDERVDPRTQSEHPLPHLTGMAIRNGWAAPDDRKPGLVDELIGILDDPDMPARAKIAAFRALLMADQVQYERDHLERAGDSAMVNLQVNIQTVPPIRDSIELAGAELANLDDGAGRVQ